MVIDHDPFPFDLPKDGNEALVERWQIRLFIERRGDDRDQNRPPTARLTSAITRS
jgi:hypothetical protein